MDWEEFLKPTRFKLLVFIVLILIFTVRLYDRQDTLYIDCEDPEGQEPCQVDGQLLVRTGFPFATYHIAVSRQGFEHLFFYDLNFFADLVIWYIFTAIFEAMLVRYHLKKKLKKGLIDFLKG